MWRLSLLALLAACGGAGVSTAVLPPLASASTSETRTVTATHAFLTDPDPSSPSDPSTLSRWMQAGYGATTIGAGEPLMPLAPPNQTVPAAGANPTLLVRFAHLPDTQLADDESPTRVCEFDQPGETSGAFRLQEGDQCRVLDAAVRTINALHQTLPISFVLTGGDNADNAQKNEAEWFMQIMDGAPRVKCDSGAADDPVPGPNNDGKDPFAAVGLAMPWWWVNGNHDVLIQGNFAVDDARRQQAVGTEAVSGTRDYSRPGAPIFNGPVVPDPERLPLLRSELMALVAADADGHGIGAAQTASGKASYSFDVAGTPLRFIVIDTCAESGGDDGIIHRADLDSTLRPLLDQSRSDGKWVVLASHHASDSKSDGSGFGGTPQTDALSADEWLAFLGGYDNIVFSMVGHSHANRVRYQAPPAGHGFWEVMTAALADYPHQFRLVEIWDDDNGWLRLRGVVTDYATDGDPLAEEGKTLGVAESVAGWAADGAGEMTDRNVELFAPKP
jgi:3',5'-cyclic AMP phosphodiesterase CpdA